jgi:tetratricopeptide (TPR) repeat protein
VLAQRLREARNPATDSPIFQLVEGFPEIDHTKTDVFRNQVRYSVEKKEKLARGRRQGVEALRELENEFGPIHDLESGVVIDLFLSYRAVGAWTDMIDLVKKMSPPLAATVMVQEQLALALNRRAERSDSDEAEEVLKALLSRRGPSSETYGILGRVYKDRWEAALKRGDRFLARGELNKAINAYLRGFETDWRDAYPGINAVTLMELHEPPDLRREKLIPVVAYAVEQRISTGKADYWDYATRLELAVLARDETGALEALTNALAAIREFWEPETTTRNLRLIREARERREEQVPWASGIEAELERAAKAP